jgi:hypothetical protein
MAANAARIIANTPSASWVSGEQAAYLCAIGGVRPIDRQARRVACPKGRKIYAAQLG